MGVDLRELLRAGAPALAPVDPAGTPGVPEGKGKKWARGQLADIGGELQRQQDMLYAGAQAAPAAHRRVLLVLQGMDCAGKGGTVRKVGGVMNPRSVRVNAFGPHTEQERRQHFLWRITRALPAHGYVGVFDRSHYEDVLVARVQSLVPEEVWRARYDEINQWEAELAAAGTAIVKVLLHLSYQEQTNRLRARLDKETKHWKFDPADIDERLRWEEYRVAYDEALTRCSTDLAPWYVVPADRKWYRNWAVARLLLATMEDLGLSYPEATFDVAAQRRRLARTAGAPPPT